MAEVPVHLILLTSDTTPTTTDHDGANHTDSLPRPPHPSHSAPADHPHPILSDPCHPNWVSTNANAAVAAETQVGDTLPAVFDASSRI